MTYDEFKKIAPRETVDFVDEALPYLKYYLENDYSIKFRSLHDDYADDIIFLIFLYILSDNKKYANFFIQRGFDNKRIHIKKGIDFSIDEEKEFKWISRALPKYKNELKYYVISPIDFAYTISKNFSVTYTSEVGELFENKTNLSSFSNDLKEYSEIIKKENLDNLKKEFTKDLPVSVINYFEMASRMAKLFQKEEFNGNEILAFSLIISLFLYSDVSEKLIILELLDKAGITNEKIWKFIKNKYYESDLDEVSPDYLTIKAYFEPIIKKLKEKNIPISVGTIVEVFLDRDLPYSIIIEQILIKIGTDPSVLLNFGDKVKKELENKKSKYLIANYDKTVINFIDDVLKIHERITQIMNVGHHNEEILNSIDDVLELSMCLSLSKNSPEYFTFFEEKGLTINQILNTLNLPPIIMDIVDDKPNYNLFGKYYQSYFTSDFNNSKTNLKIKDIAPRIFNDLLNKSQLLEKICKFNNVDYNILKVEVENGKSYVAMLPMNKKISILNEEPIDNLDLNNMESILKFGTSLINHSNYIHNEMPQLLLNETHNQAINTLNKSLNQIYIPEKPKKSFLDKLFKKNEVVYPSINLETLKNLKSEIEDNLKILYKEVIGYEEYKKYLEAYRQKNSIYYKIITKAIAEIELEPVKDDFLKQLNIDSLKEILNNKMTRFSTTEVLMKQELIHLNKTIVEHFITITTLEIARDDLLPLVGIELSINKGMNSENKSLELSRNIFGLFSSLLNQNIEAASANMEILNNSNLPKTNLALINKDLIDYYKQLNTIESLDNEIWKINNNALEKKDETISLESSESLSLNLK